MLVLVLVNAIRFILKEPSNWATQVGQKTPLDTTGDCLWISTLVTAHCRWHRYFLLYGGRKDTQPHLLLSRCCQQLSQSSVRSSSPSKSRCHGLKTNMRI